MLAVYVSTIGSCMPSRRLRRLDVPLIRVSKEETKHRCLSVVTEIDQHQDFKANAQTAF